MDKGAKLISGEVVGLNAVTVIINGRAYVIDPPTIHKFEGATRCLADVNLREDAQTIKELLLSNQDCSAYARALSWLINDDESLTKELEKGSYEDVVNALEEGLALMSPQVFWKAASLMKTASLLTASRNPK